jgi:hypothetical protein
MTKKRADNPNPIKRANMLTVQLFQYVDGQDPVTLAPTRIQTNIREIGAAISPVGGQMYYENMATGTNIDVSHRAFIDFIPNVDQTYHIIRLSYMNDNTVQTEVFAVRRVAPWEGNRKYIVLDLWEETKSQ